MIKPRIEEIKFIGGAARFWVGAMAGSSALNPRLTITDLNSNQVIADRVCYAVAGAYSGGGSVGGSDNRMLETVAANTAEYARLNQ